MKKSLIAVVIALVLLSIIGYGLFAPGKYDGLAKCLTEKGVKMYGAYWCPHCAKQKALFGKSFEYVNYIECSLPNKAGQTELCKEAGIEGYPTWEFASGERLPGEQTLQALSEKSACEA